MCGIVGVYHLDNNPVSKRSIQCMNDTLVHRGPDSQNVFVGHSIGFGHRRLKIIDLSRRADQPMWDLRRRALLVYNGMIYNFKEIREELKGHGFKFASASDSEVIINSYLQWGPACVDRFNGMFAFALWHKDTGDVFLARDRYGIKPLYYFFNGKSLIFASEIKAILTNRHIVREVDPQAMAEYWSFQNVLSDKTLFKGIQMLPAGCRMLVNKKGLRLERYWDFDFSGYSQNSEPVSFYIKQLRRVFPEAIKRSVISDVSLGSYLSGGLDSASIVQVASRLKARLATFTAGFDAKDICGEETNFDERRLARKTSQRFNTRHHELLINPKQMIELLPKLVWHLEDLRVGICYQNYSIAQFAGKFVKSILSGAGGDELLAGYPWRYQAALGAKTSSDFLNSYYNYWSRLVPDADKKDFFTSDLLKKINGYSASEAFRDVYSGFKEPAVNVDKKELFLNKAFYFEAKTFLHGLFVVEDKISMANSLEVRVPFLDNELVEILQRVPALFKLSFSNNRLRGKIILRQMMKQLLPKQVLAAAKVGFSVPDASWYRKEGYGYIQEILLSRESFKRGFFKKAYIDNIIRQHYRGERNNRLLIWSLLCFEWWNRIFIDQCWQGPR